MFQLWCVNALSGLYLISTTEIGNYIFSAVILCQCPLGLIPHFYSFKDNIEDCMNNKVSMPSRAYTSFLRSLNDEMVSTRQTGVNALSGLYLISTQHHLILILLQMTCQCPLGLIPHFYGTPSKT